RAGFSVSVSTTSVSSLLDSGLLSDSGLLFDSGLLLELDLLELDLLLELGLLELGLLELDLVLDADLPELGLGLLPELDLTEEPPGLLVELLLELELTLIEQAGSTRQALRKKPRTVGLRCIIGPRSVGTDGRSATAIQGSRPASGTFQAPDSSRPARSASPELIFGTPAVRPTFGMRLERNSHFSP